MLSLVILAAGRGKRMRSATPKVLHPLLGCPLLEYALEKGEGLGVDRCVVVVGHGREAIQAAFDGRGVTWAVQEEQLGTAHATHVGIEALRPGPVPESADSQEVIVLNGDLPLLKLPTLEAMVSAHRRRRAGITALTCHKQDPTGFGRIVRDSRGLLERIVEEADTDSETRRISEVNVGTYIFSVETFRTYYARIDRDNVQGELYLTDVVVEAARDGTSVELVSVADERETAQVNSRLELARASEILRGWLLEEYMEAGVTVDDPRTTYIEKGVRIGGDARIHPFTVIRRGVEIAPGSEVGPFAHLRPGTVLEEGASIGNFVEIKGSRVRAGAKIRHLSYVGDGDVGRRVNLGAGTIFANYDGKAKHRTIIGDEAFIGSGTILVAPVRVGQRAVTGAGAVVLKGRDVEDGDVVAGVPARSIRKQSTERKG